MALKTKSVWSAIESGDGLRLLVSRFRGRGMPTTRYDVWMASLGPSERLLRDFQGGRVSWAQFKRRYTEDLFAGGGVDDDNRTIKNHGQKFTLRLIKELARGRDVTLLCQCAEEQEHCHRHVLQKIISSGRV